MKNRVTCADRSQWRRWLQDNHDSQTEIWLVFFKKSTGKPTITYRESVEEALCFGWIDGLKKSIDEARYAHRFTPRKTGSKWSALNIGLAEKMIAEGMMTPAGQTVFEKREFYDEKFLKARRAKEIALTPEIESALKASALAWKNFRDLAPGYRKQYMAWILDAKRPETRQRRLEKAVRMLEQNKKPGMS